MTQRNHQALSAGAAVGMTVAGSISFVLVPVLVSILRREAAALGISESQVGILGSADPSGMFIGAVIAYLAVTRVDQKMMAILSLSTLAVINALSCFVSDFHSLLVLRILAGTCGGLAMAVGFSLMGVSLRPGRNFAAFNIAQTLTGAGLAYVLATLDAALALTHLFLAALGISLIGLIASTWIDVPPIRKSATRDVPRPNGRMAILSLLTLAANLLYAMGFLMLWANIQSFGEFGGVSKEVIKACVPIGLVGGSLGALVASYLEGKLSKMFLLVVFSSFMGLSLLGVVWSPSAMIFLAAAFGFQFAVGLQVFVFGSISAADPSGRLPVVLLFSLKSGFALGPAVASQAIVWGGYMGLGAITAMTLMASFLLFAFLMSRASMGMRLHVEQRAEPAPLQ